MKDLSLVEPVFWLLAAVTVFSSFGVALSRNILYSAFALMGTLLGAAGLFVLLAADFVAVVQVLVYVGGILVLVIFAVMLTHHIGDMSVSNRALGRGWALAVVAVVGAVMAMAMAAAPWREVTPQSPTPTTYAIGDAFLSSYLFPFELASLVLLVALVAAVMLSRKELRRS